MELLRNPEDRGYPAEYLLSRIRGRRARLLRDWKPLLFGVAPLERLSSAIYGSTARDNSPEGVWRNLAREYAWIYGQMNGRLRDIFRPFFLYAELRTLFICLRQVEEKKAGWTGELLGSSLLSDQIKKVLATSVDVSSAVFGLGRVFSKWSPAFRGLSNVFDTGGLRGVEQRMTNACLAVIVDTKLDPVMKRFFARLIDSRNLMGLSKYLRLKKKALPFFIKGGALRESMLRDILAKGDPAGANSLVRRFTGVTTETPGPADVEIALYKGMTRFLRKAGRDPSGAAPVLDYLWRCSIEAANLGVLLSGKDLERDVVEAELVQ